MNDHSFFSELKRRNVYKVAVAYAVVSWLLIQIATQVFPFFEIPNWAVRLVVILLILGFPVTLILSWAFEITPEGIKRESEIGPVESITRNTGRKIVGITIVLAVIAAGLLAFQILRPAGTSLRGVPKPEVGRLGEPSLPVPEKSIAVLPFDNLSDDKSRGHTEQSIASRPPTEPRSVEANSVAVLPFDNLSEDKENEYFSDGISEELLTVLQKIPGLHVAARTSAFSFKGKNTTAQEIGQKLGVANLVEGSVRKAGQTVRIAARLSRVDTGEEQWSENFTRNLKDVFAVQTEIAQTIVEQLKGQLTGGVANSQAKEAIQAEVRAAEKGGTKNVEAHEAYLQGRFFLNRHSEKETAQARAAFERAVQLDPKFALAWAGLAQTHVWDCNYATEGGQKGFNDHLAAARDAVQQALSLEPDLPEALYPKAVIETNFDYDWKDAGETLRKALTSAPQDSTLLEWAGSLALTRSQAQQGSDLIRRAVALDPVNAQARAILANHLSNAGNQEESRAEYGRVIELNPLAPNSYAAFGMTYVLQGKFEEAVTAAEKDTADWARLLTVSCARWGQKRIAESDAALAELIAKNGEVAAYQVAEVYAYRNDKDKAFEWLERARRQRDAGIPGLRPDVLLKNLHNDPRWDALLRKVGLADDQLK